MDGIPKLIDDTKALISKLPEVAVAFLIGFVLIKITELVFERTLKVFRVPKALIFILRSLVTVVLWVILISHLLRLVGLNQVAITISGSLLVVGLAIANGANTLVADVLSGLFLAKDPDFDIGYRIKSGDTEGVIEAIDIRKTRIRTDDDILIVVPNSVVDKDRWQIIDRPNKRPAKTTEMK